MTAPVPDRIRKVRHLDAPRALVWNAIAVAENFGAWSGMRFDGGFVAGSRVGARLVAAAVEDAHEVGVEWYVEAIEAPHRVAVRWHPFPVDPAIDYSLEPTNLVTFTLASEGTGTVLVVEESGFDHIPAGRRLAAFEGNDRGWDLQLGNLGRYLGDAVRAGC